MVDPAPAIGVDGPQPPGGSPKTRTPAWKRALRAGFVLLAVGGLVWLLNHVGWATVGGSVKALGWDGVAILFGLGLVEVYGDAAAFQAAIPERVGLIPVLTINQAGGLLNRFIPWEAGEVLKGTLLTRHVSGTAAVTGTVVWNYVFRLSKPATVLVAAIVGWLLGAPDLAWLAGWMVVAAVVAFLPYLGLRIAFWLGITGGIVRALQRLKLLRRDPERTLARARALDLAVRRFWRERPGDYLRVVLFQILARLTSWASLYAVLTLIDPKYDVATCSVLWAALSVMSYVVALFPTRLGTTEGGAYAVFELAGLTPALGLTGQLMLTVKAAILNALLGALALVGPARRPPAAAPSEPVDPGAA